MSYTKITIHAVWGTKNHTPLIDFTIRPLLLKHIRENAKLKGIFIDFINSQPDHMHCLLNLNADITLAKTIQLIKGESSHWINSQAIIKNKFEWADEYYAFSVSESLIERVRTYIKNQDEHHKKISFQEEYIKLLKLHNIIPPNYNS